MCEATRKHYTNKPQKTLLLLYPSPATLFDVSVSAPFHIAGMTACDSPIAALVYPITLLLKKTCTLYNSSFLVAGTTTPTACDSPVAALVYPFAFF